MKSTILKINDLEIGFKEVVFKGINGQVEAGTITTLMGINGAGKSCLLKTLGHLIPKISGTLKLSGKEYSTFSALEFSKIVSLVLTEKFHVDFLRVDELVALGRSPFTNWAGELSTVDRNIVLKSMEQIGIRPLSEKFFSELSDGQKQKVLIARALAQEPQLLILDEPTTYLDIPSKIELLKLLRNISTTNNVAIIMSTHDLDLAKSLVDQVWLMGKDGSFTAGSPETMESAGLFKKHFYYDEL
jgi:iron complex transport system ATP-binding protein